MSAGIALALAAMLAAGEDAAPPPPPHGALVLSMTAGPAWVGGRTVVGGLALDDVLGAGASVGGEGLFRASPRFALGAYVEGTSDFSAPAGAGCGPGVARGCDGAFTRYGAVGRWSFRRTGPWEAWASVGAGGQDLRISPYGDPPRRVVVRGWELSTSIGFDWAGTRRLGLGLYASGSGGMLTRADDGTSRTSPRAATYAVHAGFRGVVRLGEALFERPDGPTTLSGWLGIPRIRPSAPRGTALSLGGRLGLAACGFCGALAGVAAEARSGAVVAGGFAEVSAFPAMDYAKPSLDYPIVQRASAGYVGAFAGAAADLGTRTRVTLAAEAGYERARVFIEWLDGATATRGKTVPFAGVRAKLAFRSAFALRSAAHEGEAGLVVFFRQPLRSACIDDGERCARLYPTGGVALEGSFEVVRLATAAAAPPVSP